jgi:hypothetical protein
MFGLQDNNFLGDKEHGHGLTGPSPYCNRKNTRANTKKAGNSTQIKCLRQIVSN